MWTVVWWYQLGLTLNLLTRALWKPQVLCGRLVSRDISGGSRRIGEGNENLVSVPVGLQEILTCSKMLRHRASGFTSHPNEVVPLKIYLFDEPATFGFNGKHTNHYTTEAIGLYVLSAYI
jgi:hypothetical protein